MYNYVLTVIFVNTFISLSNVAVVVIIEALV